MMNINFTLQKYKLIKCTAFFIFISFFILPVTGFGQIASWDCNPLTAFGPSPFTGSAGANVTITGLTRGGGVTTLPTAALRGWGGKNWNATSGGGISGSQFFSFTVVANTGYILSLTNINPFDYRRSASGPSSGLVQYQINANGFVDITTVAFASTSSGGASAGPVDLSGVAALQNLPDTSVVTIRIIPYGASTTSGTFYIFDRANSVVADFVLNGTVTSASANTITASNTLTTPFNLANCTDTATGSVDFLSTGTFTGNTYSAWLSDGLGSFASPVKVGTLTSDLNNGTINITIPAGTPTNSGYKIRVTSSSPTAIVSNLTSTAPFQINQSGSCVSDSTDYFRSNVTTGNWGTPASWQSSNNNVNWITSTRVPDSSSKGITILTNHVITVAATPAKAVDKLVINSGGTLVIASAATITFTHGSGTDVDVYGTINNTGTITQTATDTIVFQANSLYNHSSIVTVSNLLPTATWNISSTCLVSGMTTTSTAPVSGSLRQTFGKFIWSCADQSAPYYVNQSLFKVNSKLTVDTTGSSYLSLSSDAAGVAYANTIQNIDVNGGTFYMTYNIGAGAISVMLLDINNDLNVNGGTFCLVGGTDKAKVTKFDSNVRLSIKGNLTVSGTTSNFYGSNTPGKWYIGRVTFNRPPGFGAQTVNFTNASTNTFGYINYYVESGSTLNILSGGIPVRSASLADYDSVTVNSLGTLDFGADGKIYKATGSTTHAAFRALNESNIITSNPNGLVGNGSNAGLQVDSLQFGTSSALGKGVNYTFNAATITAFPTLVQARITAPQRFFNPDTVTLNANITINRALTVTHVLNLGTNILTQAGSNLTFSTITGTGTVSADSTSVLTVVPLGGLTPVGTLTLTPGFQKTASLQMTRTGMLVLGSDITMDATWPSSASNCLILSLGKIDAAGRTLTFISTAGRFPISGTATLNVDDSTSFIFGVPGLTAGNNFTIPNNIFQYTNLATGTIKIKNLTVNRTNQLSFGNQSFTINGTLSLTKGLLLNNNLTLTFQNGNIPIVRPVGGGTLTIGATGTLNFGTIVAGTKAGAAFKIPDSTFTTFPTITNFNMYRTNTLTLGNQGFTTSGTFQVAEGTLDADTNTLNGTGQLYMPNTGLNVLKLGKIKTILPELATYNLMGGIIEFTGTDTQYVKAIDYYTLQSSSTGYRVLPNSGEVGIKGHLYPGSNIFDITNSVVNFKGSINQQINGFTTTAPAPYTRQFNTLLATVSGTKNVGSNFTILDSMRVDNCTINPGNDTITLRSLLTKTARIAGGTGNFSTLGTGGVMIERLIPAKRAWRLMTGPLFFNKSIHDCWQEGTTTTTDNPHPGYGTHITGGAARTELEGFDVKAGAKSSIYSYKNSDSTWSIIPANTNTSYVNGKAYMLFIRGSRAINLATSTPSTTPDTTIIRSFGIPRSTSYSTPALGAGFHAIGNPYAGPINFHTTTKSDIIGGLGGNDAYYMWDPNLTGSNSVGAYVAFSWNGATYDQSVISGPGSTSITNTGIIPSSAGFMVNHDVTASSFVVNPSDVTTDAGGRSWVFRPTGILNSRLRISLLAFNNDNSKSINDGLLINFSDQSSTAVDKEDMIKLENFAENIAVKNSGKLICIERRNYADINDTIALNMTGMKLKNYQLEIAAENITDPALLAILQDRYSNTETIISGIDTIRYNFAVTNNPATYAANRFRIVFKPSQILPVTFTGIRAFKQNKAVAVEWKVANELSIAGYDVERAVNDNQNFTKINTAVIPATGNNSSANISYNLLDEQPVSGDNFYRVKSIGTNGSVKYTSVVKVSFSRTAGVQIYPNPVTGNTIGLQMIDMPAGMYTLKLINHLGQTICTNTINHIAGNQNESIHVENTLAKGVYRLELVTPDGSIKVLSLLK